MPFFVIDRRYGISGGQPAEVFREALERAYADGAGPLGAAGDAGVCGDERLRRAREVRGGRSACIRL